MVPGDPRLALAASPEIAAEASPASREETMIRKLASGMYRIYSRKRNPKTGRSRNLGTFSSRAAAGRHEREIEFFKRRGG